MITRERSEKIILKKEYGVGRTQPFIMKKSSVKIFQKY